MNSGFIKLIRSEHTRELQKDPNAFTLLSVIAYRARRTNTFNVPNLQLGEALLGDFKNYGMTEQEYRTSKTKLKRWGFATFKATSKGTIAKLTDNSIYDINIESSNEPGNEPSNGQATTNKNDKNEKKYSCNSDEFQLASLLLEEITKRKPDYKKPNLQSWAKHIDYMIRLDKRKPDRIRAVIRWCQQDAPKRKNGFAWQNNILSTRKLREKFDKLELAMNGSNRQAQAPTVKFSGPGPSPEFLRSHLNELLRIPEKSRSARDREDITRLQEACGE